MSITGNGTTFALSAVSGGATPPSSVGRIISVGNFEGSIEDIDDNDITNTIKKYLAGDLKDFSELTLEVVFDQDVHMDIALTKIGVQYIGTLTFPLPDGQATPGDLEGSGYLKMSGGSGLANNERSVGSLTWRWDNNNTNLSYTASA